MESLVQRALRTASVEQAALAWSKFNRRRRQAGTAETFRLVGQRAAGSIVDLTRRGIGGPCMDLLLRTNAQTLFMKPGVLFIGYVEAGLGLGESLRGLIRSVATTQEPFAVYPYNRRVETRSLGPFLPDHYDKRHRYQINVFEVAANHLPEMMGDVGLWKTRHSYNILRTYWELAEAPPEWRPNLAGIDEIWAPNAFVSEAFRSIFSGPIKVVPPCVEVEVGTSHGRGEFGMDPDRFYFFFSFDYFSTPYRKNPLGVVRAFRKAFADLGLKVGLVIKSTSAVDQHSEIKEELLQHARSDERIIVIDRTLSRDEMLSLIDQSDCFVSLHRSEGFGLGLAEAMALGKPVIGTDYSGSTAFLSDQTGFPVPYTLRPVEPHEYIFAYGQSWAEPDEGAAADLMRQVVEQPEETKRRAKAGQACVQSHYGRAAVGQIVQDRLREIRASRPLP
jgi:glycosyltransferase involved in cell wall biosynthesis